MARKAWKLDTSTKGTGATVVPLRDARDREPERGLQVVVPTPREREEAPPTSRPPRRFRVVDVTVSVWKEADGRWRLLTRREQDALWRHRPAPAS